MMKNEVGQEPDHIVNVQQPCVTAIGEHFDYIIYTSYHKFKVNSAEHCSHCRKKT